MDFNARQFAMDLLTVGPLAFAAGLYGCHVMLRGGRRKSVATESSTPAAKLQLPALPIPTTVPPPFGHAHSRASLATLLAGMEYVRARLAAVSYTLDSTECRALSWLLEALAPLPPAITGHPRSDSAIIKDRLGELDKAVGPGSWWRTSQKLEGGLTGSLGAPPKLEVPEFAAIYDATFVSELARRPMSKRHARRARAEAKRTGLSVAEARARLAQQDFQSRAKQCGDYFGDHPLKISWRSDRSSAAHEREDAAVVEWR